MPQPSRSLYHRTFKRHSSTLASTQEEPVTSLDGSIEAISAQNRPRAYSAPSSLAKSTLTRETVNSSERNKLIPSHPNFPSHESPFPQTPPRHHSPDAHPHAQPHPQAHIHFQLPPPTSHHPRLKSHLSHSTSAEMSENFVSDLTSALESIAPIPGQHRPLHGTQHSTPQDEAQRDLTGLRRARVESLKVPVNSPESEQEEEEMGTGDLESILKRGEREAKGEEGFKTKREKEGRWD